MTPVGRYEQVRECCQELVSLLALPEPYQRQRFAAGLGRLLGTSVELVPIGLPLACSSLWLGCTGADHVGFNQDWPEHEIGLAGHAIGHLMLGHCGDVRDGGQFACTAGGLDDDGRRGLGRLLHDPDSGVSRLFSDAEERSATVFCCVLGERLGLRRAGQDDSGVADSFVCVG